MKPSPLFNSSVVLRQKDSSIFCFFTITLQSKMNGRVTDMLKDCMVEVYRGL